MKTSEFLLTRLENFTVLFLFIAIIAAYVLGLLIGYAIGCTSEEKSSNPECITDSLNCTWVWVTNETTVLGRPYCEVMDCRAAIKEREGVFLVCADSKFGEAQGA
jgi:hypothetical protein